MGLKKFYRSTRGLFSTVLLLLVLFTPIVLNSVFGIAYSSVLSGSMRPVFNPGDVIITRETFASRLHIGEVAVFRNPTDGTLYSHRIIGTSHKDMSASFVTKGDANPVADEDRVVVPLSAKIPRQIGRIPWLGWVIVYATNHPVTLLLDFIILFLAGYGMKRIVKAKRERPAPESDLTQE